MKRFLLAVEDWTYRVMAFALICVIVCVLMVLHGMDLLTERRERRKRMLRD